MKKSERILPYQFKPCIRPLHDEAQFKIPDAKQIKERLTPLQYSVTQEKATERPFTSEYDKFEGRVFTLMLLQENRFFFER